MPDNTQAYSQPKQSMIMLENNLQQMYSNPALPQRSVQEVILVRTAIDWNHLGNTAVHADSSCRPQGSFRPAKLLWSDCSRPKQVRVHVIRIRLKLAKKCCLFLDIFSCVKNYVFRFQVENACQMR